MIEKNGSLNDRTSNTRKFIQRIEKHFWNRDMTQKVRVKVVKKVIVPTVTHACVVDTYKQEEKQNKRHRNEILERNRK